ncbi:unnamed protein product [Spirodela intermedia]|uniref:Uncharacterized protein n=1 Tax=Spirodela intermedia TaxID=51605 RepID=A0A7I8L4T6_SPIIN|nr:unnamed protein product [Spirodela intermedia]
MNNRFPPPLWGPPLSLFSRGARREHWVMVPSHSLSSYFPFYPC